MRMKSLLNRLNLPYFLVKNFVRLRNRCPQVGRPDREG